jgi:hypothetical protein
VGGHDKPGALPSGCVTGPGTVTEPFTCGVACMALRFKLQLVAVADDDEQVFIDDIAVLDKDYERLEHLGLSLAEAKALLLELQRQVLSRQIAAFLAARVACPTCGRARGIKDQKTIAFRTVFGKLALASPRLRRCPCQHHGQSSTSPLVELLPSRTAPELLYLESKWSSLVSYGLTVKALREFLPVDAALDASSVRRDTLRVARRLEADLGPEPVFPLAGCPAECANLPAPPEPIIVGIDGGYLRDWERKQTHFVAIVGESVPTDGPPKRFGFVQSHDPKPRRHLAAVLRSQGLQHNQELVFLSDGEESLHQLQYYLRPHSQHLLDWFHLTMQLTTLGQSLKGLARLDAQRAAELQEALEHTKWNLWHGKVKRALEWLRRIEGRMWHFASRYAKFAALARVVHAFQRYLWRNGHLIPNYARRRRAGQAISTAFIESLVNSLLSKRFAKKQSMQWTPEGAHLLLQVRTRTLNGDLAGTFRRWYPAFSLTDQPVADTPLAA